MPNSLRCLAWICLAIAGLLAGPDGVSAASPKDLIQKLNATFIEVMKNAATLGYDGRYAALEPALTDAYDFPEMTRVSSGRYWRELTDAQKEQLIEAFKDYSLATYAARFKGFAGERFEVLDENPAPADSIRVNNQIVQANGQPIRIDYLLRPHGADWRIVDVYLKSSVSELAVRRSEFTSVLAKQGFDGLIAALQTKIAALKKGAPADEGGAPPAN
jgi:phospholipid transport system substrate-binding protein